jgi:cell division protein FtsZ
MAAAEAAIANPLLDETSMRGARGLLISITGGNDMTLFEVDEAATRIREEVDADANIILGATFDDSLEGVIRVSVVATGIDQVAGQDQAIEARPAEAFSRPKSQPRVVEPVKAFAPQPVAARVEPAPAPLARTEPQPAAPSLAALTAEIAQSRAAMEARIEQALAIPEPAVRQAITDLRSEPVQPAFVPPPVVAQAPIAATPAMPSFEAQPRTMAPAPMQPAATYSPVRETPTYQPAPAPTPASTVTDPRNMPRIPTRDDFPAIAQKQFEAPAAAPQNAAGPMGILRRLANNLSGHRDDEAQAAQPQSREPSFQPAPASDFSKRAQPQRPDGQPRTAAGSLDPNGRPQPRINDEDQLDIPAFLRRQAN